MMSLIKKHQDISVRCVSLEKLWNTKEPSFKAIEVESGKRVLTYLLRSELYKMAEIIGIVVTPTQIDYAIKYIMNDYYSYSISDLTIITNRIMKSKAYGKGSIRDITSEIDTYSIEKQEFAVNKRIKENSIKKADGSMTNEKVLATYQSLKSKPKELSQKEIDAENNRIHLDKLKEFEKIYKK